VPWAKGRCLLWDFTFPDTLVLSLINKSSIACGSAASEAEAHKFTKYSKHMFAHTFIPVAVDTFGVHGPEAQSLIVDLGRRITWISGETRSTAFLRQSLDIAMQRGNVA